ncbi:hypothetical protein KDE13_07460 [Campylobacter sp. faydin G-140]|uniref:hypothetical protein n=1 Tax=Campylobacter anatolicus TaxID=2829105 RepID=UPI001B9162C1|nr:hypothetical protein [Campylobacter anatolicus]MBR8466174.1 hypothetical protein [Campylobacter anatolicus]
MKYYIADVKDTRWNSINFEFVGALNGQTYVATNDNVSFAKAVSLPQELRDRSNLAEFLPILEAEFKNRVQTILDQKAKEKGYDSIVSAVSYAGYENVFQTEAINFGKWRANVWAWGYKVLEDVKSGKIDITSTDINEVLASMPEFKGDSND